MQNISLNVKPLSAKGISFLILGIALIAIPALAQSIINLSLIMLNIKLSLPTTITLLQNMTWINLVPKAVGLAIVSTLIIRSHLKVDAPKTKRQITKFSIIALTGLMLLGACAVETPFASAQATALTGYILDTPLPIADWYIGTYGTNNYFAINGSNWDNLMRGVGSTAWSAYSTNYTKVEELVLAAVTSGSVYIKDVPFNLALMGNIPENVQVNCNYQGVTYTYANPLDTVGSPYTVSVGEGPNTGYYLAADSKDRILWSSTDAATTFNQISAVGIKVQFGTGVFNMATPMVTKAYMTIEGAGSSNHNNAPYITYLNNTSGGDIFINQNPNAPVGSEVDVGITIKDLTTYGNRSIYFSRVLRASIQDITTLAVSSGGRQNVYLKDCEVIDILNSYHMGGGIYVTNPAEKRGSMKFSGGGVMGGTTVVGIELANQACEITIENMELDEMKVNLFIHDAFTKSITVSNCMITNSREEAIILQNASSVQIIGNRIRDNGWTTPGAFSAIKLISSQGNIISNNQILNIDHPNTNIAVEETGTSEYNLITGNSIAVIANPPIVKIGTYTVLGINQGAPLTLVSAYITGAQSFNNNPAVVAFDHANIDANSEFNTTTHRFTATYTGNYEVTLTVTATPNDTDKYLRCWLAINGDPRNKALTTYSTATNPVSVELKATLHMNAGDYLEAYVNTNTVNLASILGSADYNSPEFTYMTIRYVT